MLTADFEQSRQSVAGYSLPSVDNPMVQPYQNYPQFLEGLKAQQADAITGLVERYSPWVLRIIARTMGPQSDCEPVVNDAFFKLYQMAPRFDERAEVEDGLRALVATISSRLALDQIRKQNRRLQPISLDRVDLPTTAHNNPEVITLLNERSRTIAAALSALPPSQRQVVILNHLEELPHAEISARVSRPLGTVKSQMRMAHKKLAGELAEYYHS